MELLVLLVADYANIADRGKLNVMGIFSEIYATNFPARHPEMHLILKLSASPAEYGTNRKITVKLLDEDATQELVDWSQEIVIPQGTAGRRVEINNILRLRDIFFPAPGTYEFSVLVDQDQKGSLPLFIIQGTPPGA